MLVVLFAMFAGEPAPTDIAIVVSRDVCELVAKTLNASTEKPADLRFGCYERAPRTST